jgi:hypothetical protein
MVTDMQDEPSKVLESAAMRISDFLIGSAAPRWAGGLILSTALVFAQAPGWRTVDQPAPNQSTPGSVQADPATPVTAPDQPLAPPPAAPGSVQADPSTPVTTPDQPLAPPPAAPGSAQADPSTPVATPYQPSPPPPAPPAATLPAQLTIPAGKYITMRVNQGLSSDRNQVGDYFNGSLTDPIVVDGFIVAERGQTVSGRVAQVEKAGHISGVSKLGLQLTELTAVDGQQLTLQTQLIGRSGPSMAARNGAVIAGSTGIGAAVGAASTWDRGLGAGVGAGVGALAGVLLSHGAPAVIYPESLLTFRLEAPVTVATDRSPQAFRPVGPADYQQYQAPGFQTGAPRPAPGTYPPGAYPAGPSPYGYGYAPGYPYPYPYAYAYPYGYPFWGPGFGVVIGPGFYGRGFYGGGFYRGFRR